MQIGRRNLLACAAAFAALAVSRARAEAPILTDDGLYKESWFLESFLDLTDDLDPNQVAEAHSFPGVTTAIVSTDGFRHISFNTRRPPLDEVGDSRQAAQQTAFANAQRLPVCLFGCGPRRI